MTEDNKTGTTADLAYNTASGIDGLVSSAYAYARGWWGKEPSLGLAEMGSDLFYYGYDNKQKSLCSYDLSAESYGFSSTSGTNAVNNNPCLDQYWELFYAGIDVCNNTLKYVDESSAIDDTQKAAYEADAYFPNLDKMPEWELTEESDEQVYFDLTYTYRIYTRK